MILPNGRVADKAGGEQDLVGGLEDALKMRGKSLGERKLFGNAVKTNAPSDMPLFAGHFEQSVKPAGDRGSKRGVSSRRKHDGVSGLDVGPKNGR